MFRIQILLRTPPIGLVTHQHSSATRFAIQQLLIVSGTARVGTLPENPYVRATADDFNQSPLTRGSGYASGVPGQIPHY
eukprot:3924235-Pyramimonas_sp.AAC.1